MPSLQPHRWQTAPNCLQALLRELACSADQNKQAVQTLQALQAVFTKVHNSLHVIFVTLNSRPYDDLLRHPGCESDCTIFHLGNLSLATRRQPSCKGCIWFRSLRSEQETTLRAEENMYAALHLLRAKFFINIKIKETRGLEFGIYENVNSTVSITTGCFFNCPHPLPWIC